MGSKGAPCVAAERRRARYVLVRPLTSARRAALLAARAASVRGMSAGRLRGSGQQTARQGCKSVLFKACEAHGAARVGSFPVHMRVVHYTSDVTSDVMGLHARARAHVVHPARCRAGQAAAQQRSAGWL